MFQTNPNTQQEVKEVKKSWYKEFASQPHQPFFFNGLLFLTLFILVLFLHYSNIIHTEVSLSIFHGYALVFLVFVQFFLGFLFVVFPRFLMQAEITPDVYMKQFYWYTFASIAFFISMFISKYLVLLSALVLLYAQVQSFFTLYDIYNKSTMKDKYDTKWVLISFCTGLVAHGFFIVSLVDFELSYIMQNSALYAGFYLFIFAVIFTISQRMIPFFTSVKVQGYVINKSKYLMEMVFILLVLKVVIITLQMPELNFLADIPLLFVFTKELIKWKLPVRQVVPIMWVLYLSLYWIPFGFLLSSTESIMAFIGMDFVFEKSVLHTFALGYFITILLGFGSRVVLGHSGRTPMADKLTTAIFLLVQVVVVLRLIASFSMNFEMNYIFWINASALFLMVLLVIWAIKYVPILIKLK